MLSTVREVTFFDAAVIYVGYVDIYCRQTQFYHLDGNIVRQF